MEQCLKVAHVNRFGKTTSYLTFFRSLRTDMRLADFILRDMEPIRAMGSICRHPVAGSSKHEVSSVA
jgi:hypothetical protein